MTVQHNPDKTMKKAVFTFISLLCFTLSYGQTAIEQAERDYERGREMVQNKRFDEALALWDSLSARAVPDDYKAKYLALCGVLAHDSLHDTARALKYYLRAEAYYPALMQKKSGHAESGIIYASMGLGSYCDSLKLYAKAIGYYKKAIGLINHYSMQGIEVGDKSPEDLHLMLLSFKQCVAIDYGHNRQFDVAQTAFEELDFEFGQMEESSDPDLMAQGWMFGCMLQQHYAMMYEKDMNDSNKALREVNALLDKMKDGLDRQDPSINEVLEYLMPWTLWYAAHLYNKTGKPATAITLCDDALAYPSADQWKPDIINTRGEALLLQGKNEEARRHWSQVKEMKPDFYDNDGDDLTLRKKFGK